MTSQLQARFDAMYAASPVPTVMRMRQAAQATSTPATSVASSAAAGSLHTILSPATQTLQTPLQHRLDARVAAVVAASPMPTSGRAPYAGGHTPTSTPSAPNRMAALLSSLPSTLPASAAPSAASLSRSHFSTVSGGASTPNLNTSIHRPRPSSDASTQALVARLRRHSATSSTPQADHQAFSHAWPAPAPSPATLPPHVVSPLAAMALQNAQLRREAAEAKAQAAAASTAAANALAAVEALRAATSRGAPHTPPPGGDANTTILSSSTGHRTAHRAAPHTPPDGARADTTILSSSSTPPPTRRLSAVSGLAALSSRGSASPASPVAVRQRVPLTPQASPHATEPDSESDGEQGGEASSAASQSSPPSSPEAGTGASPAPGAPLLTGLAAWALGGVPTSTASRRASSAPRARASQPSRPLTAPRTQPRQRRGKRALPASPAPSSGLLGLFGLAPPDPPASPDTPTPPPPRQGDGSPRRRAKAPPSPKQRKRPRRPDTPRASSKGRPRITRAAKSGGAARGMRPSRSKRPRGAAGAEEASWEPSTKDPAGPSGGTPTTRRTRRSAAAKLPGNLHSDTAYDIAWPREVPQLLILVDSMPNDTPNFWRGIARQMRSLGSGDWTAEQCRRAWEEARGAAAASEAPAEGGRESRPAAASPAATPAESSPVGAAQGPAGTEQAKSRDDEGADKPDEHMLDKGKGTTLSARQEPTPLSGQALPSTRRRAPRGRSAEAPSPKKAPLTVSQVMAGGLGGKGTLKRRKQVRALREAVKAQEGAAHPDIFAQPAVEKATSGEGSAGARHTRRGWDSMQLSGEVAAAARAQAEREVEGNSPHSPASVTAGATRSGRAFASQEDASPREAEAQDEAGVHSNQPTAPAHRAQASTPETSEAPHGASEPALAGRIEPTAQSGADGGEGGVAAVEAVQSEQALDKRTPSPPSHLQTPARPPPRSSARRRSSRRKSTRHSTPGSVGPLNLSGLDSSFDVSFSGMDAQTPRPRVTAATPGSVPSASHGLLGSIDRDVNDAYLVALQRKRGAFRVQAPARGSTRSADGGARRGALRRPGRGRKAASGTMGEDTAGITLRGEVSPGGTTHVVYDVDEDARAEAELAGHAGAKVHVSGGRVEVDEEDEEHDERRGVGASPGERGRKGSASTLAQRKDSKARGGNAGAEAGALPHTTHVAPRPDEAVTPSRPTGAGEGKEGRGRRSSPSTRRASAAGTAPSALEGQAAQSKTHSTTKGPDARPGGLLADLDTDSDGGGSSAQLFGMQQGGEEDFGKGILLM